MTLPAADHVLQLALGKSWLSPAQVEEAQAKLARTGAGRDPAVTLRAMLAADGLLDSWQIARLQAEALGLDCVDLEKVRIPAEVRKLLPRDLAERLRVMPFACEGNILRLAVSDPDDFSVVDSVRQSLAMEVEAYIAPAEDIARAMARFYDEGSDGHEFTGSVRSRVSANEGGERGALQQSEAGQNDVSVIGMVQDMIQEAIRRRASDIHVEPLEHRLRIRYRIDGVLVEMRDAPKHLQAAIISRLKIMSDINIAEKRIPQDGRIQIKQEGRALDVRVSCLPSIYGESLVLRILNQDAHRLALPDLGMAPDDLGRFEPLIRAANGLMLVTGPTGSGKTTTLYSCLHQLNQPERKIVTVEDPVEYQLSGINQVPVREEIGMTFGLVLRAMLRQAPNIIMVGEIRDRETAETALHASLTGHLVFSTLHTNDAPSAVARLTDLGVKPFLLAAALRAVLAQRLVRRICPHCARPHRPTAGELSVLGLSRAAAGAADFRRGAGCPECTGTGYRGRLGLFELLVVNEEFSQLIHERAGPARLRGQARALGLRSLREDGARKAIAGLTTIEEVVSNTVGDTS